MWKALSRTRIAAGKQGKRSAGEPPTASVQDDHWRSIQKTSIQKASTENVVSVGANPVVGALAGQARGDVRPGDVSAGLLDGRILSDVSPAISRSADTARRPVITSPSGLSHRKSPADVRRPSTGRASRGSASSKRAGVMRPLGTGKWRRSGSGVTIGRTQLLWSYQVMGLP